MLLVIAEHGAEKEKEKNNSYDVTSIKCLHFNILIFKRFQDDLHICYFKSIVVNGNSAINSLWN